MRRSQPTLGCRCWSLRCWPVLLREPEPEEVESESQSPRAQGPVCKQGREHHKAAESRSRFSNDVAELQLLREEGKVMPK